MPCKTVYHKNSYIIYLYCMTVGKLLIFYYYYYIGRLVKQLLWLLGCKRDQPLQIKEKAQAIRIRRATKKTRISQKFGKKIKICEKAPIKYLYVCKLIFLPVPEIYCKVYLMKSVYIIINLSNLCNYNLTKLI